jgi:hypothetical protein
MLQSLLAFRGDCTQGIRRGISLIRILRAFIETSVAVAHDRTDLSTGTTTKVSSVRNRR